MAQAPSPATKSTDLPTIIIDPSAYEPDRPQSTETLYDNFIRLTRVTLAAMAVGAATFGIAHLLEADSLLPEAWVSALTTAPPRSADKSEAREQSKTNDEAVQAAAPAPAPVQASAQAPQEATEQIAEPATAPAEAAASALPAAEPSAPVLGASTEPSAATPALASAPVNQARPTASNALAKALNKTANVQDEIRNARRLLAMNQLEQAEAAYRGALALNEREPAALTGLARVQLARGELDDALASALRAVEKAPDFASAQLTLGDVLRARGDKTGAQAHYDQAAQDKPAAGASAP
jgi:tetratricopeptide (TPR) repeat protein